MKEMQLKTWTVRPMLGGVCVDGLRVDDASGIYWHSSSIIKRINSHLLETSSGSRYRLVGDLDENYAKEVSDYLLSLISQFKHGFPKKWKSLIESTARATAAKYKRDKQTKATETIQASDNKTSLRRNMADGKQSCETSRNVRPLNCLTNKRAVLSNKGVGRETPYLRLHSITRSMTKKLEQPKMRIMPDSEGSSLEDTLNDTLLALRKRNFPLGQALRKRKRPSDNGVASKKRKVESHAVRQNVRTDIFPTPALHINDVLLDSFSSQRTSQKKRRRMVSTDIEPDILTLEGLLSPPVDTSEKRPKMLSFPRIILNPVIVPFDLELEEDVLQKSFMDVAEEDFSKKQSKMRSRTVQPKQQRAPTKQRKSRSQAPSKSQNSQSVQMVNSETLCGGHNLRPRTVKKDVIPGATGEPRRKLERLGSKSRCGLKKQKPSENVINCKNNEEMTAKTLQNNAALGSKASRKAMTVKSSLDKGPTQQKSENCDQKQPCVCLGDKVESTLKNDSQNHVRPRSGSRVKPVEFELCTSRTEQIVGFRNDKMLKSVTQSKNPASSDDEPSIAVRSMVTDSINTIQQKDGEVGQGLVGDCPNQVRPRVHESRMTMEAKRIHAAEMLYPKNVEEREGSNEAMTLELTEKRNNNAVNGNKITSVVQKVGTNISCGSTSMTCAKDTNLANAQSPQLHDLHHVTSLYSKPMEESESRNSATVSELTEKRKPIDSGKNTNITLGEVSCIIQSSDTQLKSHDRQVTETPNSCGKLQRNIRSVGHSKLRIKNKTTQVTPNMDRTDTSGESPERISVLVKNLKPKEKKAMVNKNKSDRKKENKGAAVTEPNEIENGKRGLSTQRIHERLEEKMSSKTKVIPSLPADSVQVEVEPVEECCLAKCSEENVAVNTKVMPPKQTRKSRKVAKVPASVISVKSQKSQPKGNKDKASEMNDPILANKNEQVTNVKLLGGRGTLKRQKQLRKLIEENMYCKDTNDFFSSTPFQSPRARRFAFPPFEEEDDIFAKGDLKEPLNYDMTDVTPHGLFRVMDYTANKTPATTPDTAATPAGIKRRRSEQEAYIHRVKKLLCPGQRKGPMSQNIRKKPKAKCEPAAGASWMPVLDIDKDLFEVKEVREQDSEEEDYYFADD